MFPNPFTPVFGGKPDCFFGRKDILARFDAAMVDQGSEDRTLFITANRGGGKTALLEQLSQRATASGRKVVDVTAENAIGSMLKQLVRHNETTSTFNPELEVTILGSGGRLAGVATSKTTRYDENDLELVFLEASRDEPKGILVTIDEIQKIAPRDVSLICAAFQMASRKGHDVMLAVAGLPYAHDQVIQYEGCTYMRRVVHEELGLFDPNEVRTAYELAFSRCKGLELEPESLDLLVEASLGHPYAMQLLGYHLVAAINNRCPARAYRVTPADVETARPLAIAAYERRALKPMLDVMPSEERRYLEAMARTAQEDRVCRTSTIAASLGKTPQQLSRIRNELIRNGVIIAVGRGELMFNIPYLREYVLKEPVDSPNAALVRRWGL